MNLAAYLAAALMAASDLPNPAPPSSGQPYLAAANGRVYLSWIEPAPDKSHALRFSVFENRRWSEARTISSGSGWFINFADFPSILPLPGGRYAAHWLARDREGKYSYGLKITHSTDGGSAWQETFAPKSPSPDSYTGFVSLAALSGGFGAVHLEGREEKGMTLKFAEFGPDGRLRSHVLLDPDVCSCCQTSAVVTADGPIVAYRDHQPGEVRDISIVRLKNGTWTPPAPLARDGWVINACPVNGPALAAEGRKVAAAWYTEAGGARRVKVALSSDSGASFGAPVAIDGGNPVGRVDILFDGAGAIVSWLERLPNSQGEIRMRKVAADGRLSPPVVVAAASPTRSTGFPRMARAGESIIVAWTAGGVRTAEVSIRDFGK